MTERWTAEHPVRSGRNRPIPRIETVIQSPRPVWHVKNVIEEDLPNVVVICVDCLREDHLETPAADTPFLDAVRSRGLEAADLHATATTTSPCVASLLTGTYSERNGVLSLDVGRLSDEVTSFGTYFRRAGYTTAAFVTGPLVAETGLDRGFDSYRYREPGQSLFGPWYDTVRHRLAGLDAPFAVYLHCWEIHEDVFVPEGFRSREYGTTRYARALSALDRRLESLVEVLPENTLLAIHGDHGESVTHRDSYARLGMKAVRDALRYYGGLDTRPAVATLNRALADESPDLPDHFLENGHGENVFDFVTHVPFLLSGPRVEGGRIEAQVRQIDVLPTILEAAGIEYDSQELDGRSMLDPDVVSDRPAYVRACGASLRSRRNWAKGVRLPDQKYVEYPGRKWPAERYDLETDPLELDPTFDPAHAESFRRHFPTADLGGGDRLEIGDRLRALGYR